MQPTTSNDTSINHTVYLFIHLARSHINFPAIPRNTITATTLKHFQISTTPNSFVRIIRSNFSYFLSLFFFFHFQLSTWNFSFCTMVHSLWMTGYSRIKQIVNLRLLAKMARYVSQSFCCRRAIRLEYSFHSDLPTMKKLGNVLSRRIPMRNKI